MIISVMTLIIAVGRNTKWMITLTLCLMPLNKILDINIHMDILTNEWRKISCEVCNNIYLFIREWAI